MQINFDNEKPIYIQLAEGIEDAILSSAFNEETQIPSTTEFSATYKINPATALKGINILVDKNILYKKRGVGMFVSKGATEIIVSERREAFYNSFVKALLLEAEKLNISKDEILSMIERGVK